MLLWLLRSELVDLGVPIHCGLTKSSGHCQAQPLFSLPYMLQGSLSKPHPLTSWLYISHGGQMTVNRGPEHTLRCAELYALLCPKCLPSRGSLVSYSWSWCLESEGHGSPRCTNQGCHLRHPWTSESTGKVLEDADAKDASQTNSINL